LSCIEVGCVLQFVEPLIQSCELVFDLFKLMRQAIPVASLQHLMAHKRDRLLDQICESGAVCDARRFDCDWRVPAVRVPEVKVESAMVYLGAYLAKDQRQALTASKRLGVAVPE
jgi:hypothetical protein